MLLKETKLDLILTVNRLQDMKYPALISSEIKKCITIHLSSAAKLVGACTYTFCKTFSNSRAHAIRVYQVKENTNSPLTEKRERMCIQTAHFSLACKTTT